MLAYYFEKMSTAVVDGLLVEVDSAGQVRDRVIPNFFQQFV